MDTPNGAPRPKPGRPPKDIVPVNVAYAASEWLKELATSVSRGTVASKKTFMTVMIDFLGPSFPLWQMDRHVFGQVVAVIISPPSPAEVAQRKAEKRSPRKGRFTTNGREEARTSLIQFAEFCFARNWLPYGYTYVRPGTKTTKQNPSEI